jgi:transposase
VLLPTLRAGDIVVMDNLGSHKQQAIRDLLRTVGAKLFFLPPYSPDLNPDEWVWKNVKNDSIGRTAIRGKDDLKAKAVSALRHLQKSPAKVRGFFGDSKLAYIFT